MNLLPFKLYRVYLDPLYLLNVVIFPRVEFLRTLSSFKKGKFVLVCSRRP